MKEPYIYHDPNSRWLESSSLKWLQNIRCPTCINLIIGNKPKTRRVQQAEFTACGSSNLNPNHTRALEIATVGSWYWGVQNFRLLVRHATWNNKSNQIQNFKWNLREAPIRTTNRTWERHQLEQQNYSNSNTESQTPLFSLNTNY